MRYLLDTMVLSEGTKPRPDEGVARFLSDAPPLHIAISVLTIGEIRQGLMGMAEGKRRRDLERWMSVRLVRQFAGRVVAVDEAVALAWGRLSADGRRSGRPLPVVAGLLLASAEVHDLILVTRNVRACADRGVKVLNPWGA